MNATSRLRALLRSPAQPRPSTRPAQPATPRPDDSASAGPCREPAGDDVMAAIDDMHATLVAQALRIRALERQLARRGEEPVGTPNGRELRSVAEVLEAASRGDVTRWNTIELRHLASLMRGLATGENR